MDMYTEPLRPSRFDGQLVQSSGSRLLATVGIVLMTVGFYVPIAERGVGINGDPARSYSQTFALIDAPVSELVGLLHFTQLSLRIELVTIAVSAVLTLGGLALLPPLWRSLSPRGAILLRRTYGVWLVLLILLAVVSLPALQEFMLQPPLGLPFDTDTGQTSYLFPGVLLLLLGVLVSAAALRLLLREPLPAAAPAPAHRTALGWSAPLVLTLGALLWVIGFYLMPQTTTAACQPLQFSVTQFARGACAGLDSNEVLHAAYYAGLGTIARLFYFVGEQFGFMVTAACITTLGGWTRQFSVATLVWLIGWPVLAVGVALVALDGVDVIAQNGYQLTLATGAGWHLAPGMVVTFIGIGLVGLGQIGLWSEMLRHKGVADTQKSTFHQELDDTP